MNPEINRIGCGAARCPTVSGLPILTNAVVLVCNYATEIQSESEAAIPIATMGVISKGIITTSMQLL